MNAKEKIKNELIELVKEGNDLFAMFKDTEKDLRFDYQNWYSRALSAVEWLAPDRYEEFRRYCEPDPKRKSLGYGTYVIQDYLKSVKPGHRQLWNFDCRGQATVGLYNQLTILASLVKRIDSALGDIQGGLYAELQDEEIESAALLLKVNARAAGALAGVILEGHFRRLPSTTASRSQGKRQLLLISMTR